jgi:DNA helicase MCM9
MQGTYDSRVSLSINTSLSGPLLSRFDIVLVLQDMKNPDWDARVADHILDGGETEEYDADVGVPSPLPLPFQ